MEIEHGIEMRSHFKRCSVAVLKKPEGYAFFDWSKFMMAFRLFLIIIHWFVFFFFFLVCSFQSAYKFKLISNSVGFNFWLGTVSDTQRDRAHEINGFESVCVCLRLHVARHLWPEFLTNCNYIMRLCRQTYALDAILNCIVSKNFQFICNILSLFILISNWNARILRIFCHWVSYISHTNECFILQYESPPSFAHTMDFCVSCTVTQPSLLCI